jgi:hypothetical protein
MKKKIKNQKVKEKKAKRLGLNVVKTNIRAGQNSGARRTSFYVF